MFKRIVQALVLFFAAYAFVFVPLGKKTALEHVVAIATTPAAKQAGSELKGGVERLVKRLRTEAEEATRDADEADADEAGVHDAAAGEPSDAPRELRRTSRSPKESPRRPVKLPSHADEQDPSLGPGGLDLDSIESLPHVDDIEKLLQQKSPKASARAPR